MSILENHIGYNSQVMANRPLPVRDKTLVVLIACSKSKLDQPRPAHQLYTSQLFRKSYAYAQQLQPDAIRILSAKHGLVHPEMHLDPYEFTLKDLDKKRVARWGELVATSLHWSVADRHEAHFVFLAGQDYIEPVAPHLVHWSNPLEGMGIGQRIQFLTKKVDRP